MIDIALGNLLPNFAGLYSTDCRRSMSLPTGPWISEPWRPCNQRRRETTHSRCGWTRSHWDVAQPGRRTLFSSTIPAMLNPVIILCLPVIVALSAMLTWTVLSFQHREYAYKGANNGWA